MPKKIYYNDTIDMFAPPSFEELAEVIRKCTKCGLRKPCIAWDVMGDLGAKTMFVGEALGETEVNLGRPFVGKAGKEFDLALSEVGIGREEIFLTNIVKARPVVGGRNRAPNSAEISACLPYLFQEIELLNPEVIVLMGGIASKAVFGKDGITKLRKEHIHGVIHNGRFIVFTYHPSYVSRSRSLGVWDEVQSAFVHDLLTAKKRMEANLQSIMVRSKGGVEEINLWDRKMKKLQYRGTCSDYVARRLIRSKSGWKVSRIGAMGYRINGIPVEFPKELQMNFLINDRLKAYMMIKAMDGSSGLRGHPSIADFILYKDKIAVFKNVELRTG